MWRRRRLRCVKAATGRPGCKARKGLVPEFTGISDPYDIPERAEVRIDTCRLMPKAAAEEIFFYLPNESLIRSVEVAQNIAEKYAN